jgi:hypothetical protein
MLRRKIQPETPRLFWFWDSSALYILGTYLFFIFLLFLTWLRCSCLVILFLAENQSHLLKKLKETFPLSDKESQVLSRGRNSVTRSKNRRNPAAYQDSTSLEALVGYVYINDPNRCQELLAWFETVIDEPME